MPIAPSTFYAARERPLSARAVNDERLKAEIARVHAKNYGVYGIRKVHAELAREGVDWARRRPRRGALHDPATDAAAGPTWHRADQDATDHAARRRPDATTVRTTSSASFVATAPDRLWVADITYMRTFAGWVYAAFVLDVFSRRIVGWQLSTSLHTDLALDALNMGLWTRAREGRETTQLIHHSDRGVQYTAIRYSQRLAEAGAVASVG